jgi:hypothetical protein
VSLEVVKKSVQCAVKKHEFLQLIERSLIKLFNEIVVWKKREIEKPPKRYKNVSEDLVYPSLKWEVVRFDGEE